jgi:hypothetical protein
MKQSSNNVKAGRKLNRNQRRLRAAVIARQSKSLILSDAHRDGGRPYADAGKIPAFPVVS